MASTGPESPPRKKLKQARLPFQVISSPRTEGEKATGSLKRKLSESDDIQITKVARSVDVEEIKENTVRDDLKAGMKAMLSSLLTSKIINNCTEICEEDDLLKQKNILKEGSPSKTLVNSEVKLSQAEDSKQKSVLSKNALDKLALWKKSPGSTPPKINIESAEKTTSVCSSKEESPEKATHYSGDGGGGENLPKPCQDDCPDSTEIVELELDETVKASPEDSAIPLSNVTDITVEKTEDRNQNSNQSANSSIMEIELEAECYEGDKKEGDLCASPKPSQTNLIVSPRTPKGITAHGKSRLTPKQLARMKEAAKKQEEKERIKLEKERKKQEEHEEKLRLKQEKEEQKRKDKEEKEENKRKEKEEKEKKRLADIEHKHEEKRRRDEQKAEEKRKKEDEKRKAEEEEERKKAKVSAMFTSFFVPKTSKTAEMETQTSLQTVQNFMPFQVKSDMRVAPCTRHHLDSNRLDLLDQVLLANKEYPAQDLYLEQLRRGVSKIGRSGRTWLRQETKDDEVFVLEADSEGVFIEQPTLERMRAKFLQFHENYRPAYYGTWRKKSHIISGRRPTAQDKILDYDVDSADEWEEEEPGESLHGSDDEKDKESEDEYEVDNSVFVPHGYLSDDEGDAEIDEDALNPEMQKAKLKVLGEEFETQMKTKTRVLKPIVILLTAAIQSDKLPGQSRYQKLADRRAVWKEDEGPIDVSRRIETSESFGTSPLAQRLDADGLTYSGSRGAKSKKVAEEAIPALITLIHGAPMKGSFLVSEFYEFLKRQSEVEAGAALPAASKASIARKLKELAAYQQCNEEGPMKGKRCWLVPPQVRERYGVANLKLPNRWKFILKRPRSESRASADKTAVAVAVMEASSSAQPASNPVDSPTTSTKTCLITNFTKVMSAEEKQLHWEKMKKIPIVKKNVAKPSSKMTAFTSLFSSSSSTPSAVAVEANTEAPKTVAVKKRVALLVSVPRGQDISSAVEAVRSSNSSTTTARAASTSQEKPPELIQLD